MFEGVRIWVYVVKKFFVLGIEGCYMKKLCNIMVVVVVIFVGFVVVEIEFSFYMGV